MLLTNTANSGANNPIYDPATLVSASTASLLAMTAFDTTNLRYTFTAPANGAVMVRIRVNTTGAAGSGTVIFLGVLQGSSVIARQIPVGGPNNATGQAYNIWTQEALFTVTGLTPGNVYTWDAAYAVIENTASSNLNYGGPNDASGNDAWGGFVYEIHDAPNLNSSILYDPGSGVNKATSSLLAMTALDTTNLRITFSPPASGSVFVRLRWELAPATSSTFPIVLGGILSGSTVVARQAPIGTWTSVTTDGWPFGQEATFSVTGLSGSQTWDAAYAVQRASALSSLRYGGPNDNLGSGNGAYLYEIWNI